MIQTGCHYWIELEGIRIRVRVDRVCEFLPGWFNCISERSGVELIIPEHAIRDRCDGEPQDGSPLAS